MTETKKERLAHFKTRAFELMARKSEKAKSQAQKDVIRNYYIGYLKEVITNVAITCGIKDAILFSKEIAAKDRQRLLRSHQITDLISAYGDFLCGSKSPVTMNGHDDAIAAGFSRIYRKDTGIEENHLMIKCLNPALKRSLVDSEDSTDMLVHYLKRLDFHAKNTHVLLSDEKNKIEIPQLIRCVALDVYGDYLNRAYPASLKRNKSLSYTTYDMTTLMDHARDLAFQHPQGSPAALTVLTKAYATFANINNRHVSGYISKKWKTMDLSSVYEPVDEIERAFQKELLGPKVSLLNFMHLKPKVILPSVK